MFVPMGKGPEVQELIAHMRQSKDGGKLVGRLE
jgi:hypothetical protein